MVYNNIDTKSVVPQKGVTHMSLASGKEEQIQISGIRWESKVAADRSLGRLKVISRRKDGWMREENSISRSHRDKRVGKWVCLAKF